MSKNRTVAGPDALRASPPTVRAVLTRRRLLVALPLASALVAALVWLPVASWTSQAVVWIRGAGAPGVAAYALLYVVATVVLAPGSVLTLGAGFAYGPLWGTLLVWPVSTLAATAAFVIARTFGRGWVERRVAGDPRFARLERAARARGLRLVVLVRLSPILPFNLLNYALGLTGIRVRDYALGSFLGMLPGTILYVYLGSLVTSAGQLASGSLPDAGPAQTALYAGGLLASLALVATVTRMARRALRAELDGVAPGPAQEQAA